MYRDDDVARLRAEVSDLTGRWTASQTRVRELELSERKLKHERDKAFEEARRLREKMSTTSRLRGFFNEHGSAVAKVIVVLVLLGCFAWFVSYLFEEAAKAKYVGTVQHRDYIAAHYTSSEICSGTGNDRHCQTIRTYHPPTWWVTLRYQDQNHEYQISEELHDEVVRGHWLCLPQARLRDCNHGRDTVVYH